MRSVDRLEQQRRMKQQKRMNTPPPQEELEEEIEFPQFVGLNKKKNAFDDAADRTFGGINTEKSIFDRTAVFHTDK